VSEPRSLTVVATGDIMVETPIKMAGVEFAAPGTRYDFLPLFAPLSPYLDAADIAICHMEFPIGAPGQEAGKYGYGEGAYKWLAPYEIADAARRAGYTRCSTASNHSNDIGEAAIDSTLNALDDAGLSHVGTARTPQEALVTTFVANEVRVAHLAYTSSNNEPPPVDWRLAQTEVERVVADVEEARRQGAEVVIVSLHIGIELLEAPIGRDRAMVEQITAATRIDAIVHHGPHVIQGYERVNGTAVYWSLGNMMSGMGRAAVGKYVDPRTLDGLMAVMRFEERPDGTFRTLASAVLLCEDVQSRIVYPALASLAGPMVAGGSESDGAVPGLDERTANRVEQCVKRSAGVLRGLG
jgi:poly-gamma-glutamate synthesis protein (capsule biosynthesis protein)